MSSRFAISNNAPVSRNVIKKEEKAFVNLRINSLKIRVLSNEYMKQISNGINIFRATRGTDIGEVNDRRMGPSNNLDCATCHQSIKQYPSCPGHYGYIDFDGLSVVHPLAGHVVAMVLSVICKQCNNIPYDKEEMTDLGLLKYNGMNRLKELIDNHLPDKRRCPLCEDGYYPVFDKKKTKDGDIVEVIKERGSTDYNNLSTYDIKERLSNITNDDAELLGFSEGSHPSSYILHGMLVIPPQSRLKTQYDTLANSDLYASNYVRIINVIKSSDSNQTRMKNLTEQVRRLFFKKKDSPQDAGIIDNISGKYGFARHHLASKRVDYSARTVITPNPTLQAGEVGIPEEIAKLGYTEQVNAGNKDILTKMIHKGVAMEFSSRALHTSEDQLTWHRVPRDERKRLNIVLRIGDYVRRPLKNGDWVIVNRQPTLHQASFIGMRARIGSHKTITIPLSSTKGMHADFDGDEANVHLVQSQAAQQEVANQLDLPSHIFSASNSLANFHLTYDNPLAAHNLSLDKRWIDDVTFQDYYLLKIDDPLPSLEDISYNLVHYRQAFPSKVTIAEQNGNKELTINEILTDLGYSTFDVELNTETVDQYLLEIDSLIKLVNSIYETYSVLTISYYYHYRSLFSLFLPENFYYRSKGVDINNSVLVSGVINADNLGQGNDSILKAIYRDRGKEAARVHLTNASHILDRYHTVKGFTVGLYDCYTKDYYDIHATREQILNARRKYNSLIDQGKKPDEELFKLASRELPRTKLQSIRERALTVLRTQAFESDFGNNFAKYLSANRDNLPDNIRKPLQYRENAYNDAVGSLRNYMERTVEQQVSDNNNLMTSVRSKAKGNIAANTQIIGSSGQKYVSGELVKPLPHSIPGEYGPEDVGYCANSLSEGASLTDIIKSYMNIRPNMTIQAVNTSQAGYAKRKLAAALDSYQVKIDGSISNDRDQIISFKYGDDGLSSEILENVNYRGYQFKSFINIEQEVHAINAAIEAQET